MQLDKILSKFNIRTLFFGGQSFLGVDIGSSSIKVVQLSKDKNGYKLDTYGEAHLNNINEDFTLKSFKILDNQVAFLINRLTGKIKIRSKKVAFGVPVFSSFSTIIKMPEIPEDELKRAINFKARQYIPVPIEQVSLSSMIIKRELDPKDKTKNIEVLLVAVPNEVKNKYLNIAKLSQLDLVALEMETFPLARALVKDKSKITLIVDIGSHSTNYCVVEDGFVRLSHNYDVSGDSITKAFMEYYDYDKEKARKLKQSVGLKMTPGQAKEARGVFFTVDSIIAETERIKNVYLNKMLKNIDQIIISGGSAMMPGILEYFKSKLGDEIYLADPFLNIKYPKELDPVLKKIGPSFSIAVGLAMRKN